VGYETVGPTAPSGTRGKTIVAQSEALRLHREGRVELRPAAKIPRQEFTTVTQTLGIDAVADARG
jgi:hypothetical protein